MKIKQRCGRTQIAAYTNEIKNFTTAGPLFSANAWMEKMIALDLHNFQMKKKTGIYNKLQKVSSVMMILALLWLTVSTPFVYASEQEFARHSMSADADVPLTSSDEEANPFGNNTEEKAPSSTSFSEEYLHDLHRSDYLFTIVSQYHKCENAGTYIAFHGELLVPPPNAA